MTDLLRALLQWATQDPNVRVVLQTGSFVRGSDDALSDLDIELHCSHSDVLLASPAWFQSLAPVWVYQALGAPNFPTRLVLFEGGRKVDFALLPISLLQKGQLSVAASAGFHVLLDKDGLTAPLHATGFVPHPPTREQFLRTRATFWMEAWSWAKYLARGDGWHARIRDNDTKVALLQMMEWYALTQNQTPRHDGHFLSEWTDAHTRAVIPSLWSDWNRSNQWRALRESCDLFTHHENAVAATFGLPLDSINTPAIQADIERIEKLDME